MYLYGNKKSKEVTGNNILSTKRPKDTILKAGYESSLDPQTRLKQKSIIKVYQDGTKNYIEHSTAYALGLLTVEEFNNPKSDYYYITEEKINSLSNMYDIEYYSLNLENSLGNNISK